MVEFTSVVGCGGLITRRLTKIGQFRQKWNALPSHQQHGDLLAYIEETRIIVRTAIEQRKLVDAATKAPATVRRGRTASSKTKVDDSGWGSLRGIDSSKPVDLDEDMSELA